MPPTLKHVMTFRVNLSKDHTLMLGSTKGGTIRVAAPLIGGFLKGDDFHADIIAGGSDWPSLDTSAGIAYLDGRASFRDKETGDMFYATIQGMAKLDEKSQLAFSFSPEAKSTKAGDHTWFTTLIFEVSNEKHKWMEQNWFISQGHWHIPGDGTQAAEHDVYMLVAG